MNIVVFDIDDTITYENQFVLRHAHECAINSSF